MGKSSSITVKILGDAKGLQGALDDSSGALGKFGHGVASVGKFAGAALLGLGAAGLAMAPGILSAGAEMEAMGRKSATVFEGSLPAMQAWAKANAAAMGMTADQAVATAAGIGDLLKPMGFTADQAAMMSANMLDMSGALSAWTGGQKSAAEVSDIITKAMLGETDGLKALGISISAADVQARLAANGQDKLTGAALEQAKAMAVQQLITEKSADAQKAWQNGSMDSLKAQNSMKAGMESLKETAIKALYPALQAVVPIITKAAAWIGERLPGAIAVAKRIAGDLVAKFKEWWPSIRKVIGAVVDWLTGTAWPAIQKVWKFIGDGVGMLVGWVRDHWAQISNVVQQAIGFVRGAIETGVQAVQWVWQNFGSQIVSVLTAAWEYVKGVVSAAMEFIHGVINVVMGVIHGDWSQVWEGIKGMFSGVWDYLKTIVSTAVSVIGSVLSAAWTGIQMVTSTVWEAVKGAVLAPIQLVQAGVSAAVDVVKSVVTGAWDAISSATSSVWNGISSFIVGVVGGIGSAISGVWSGIVGGIKGTVNAVVDAVNWVIKKINSFQIHITIPMPPGIDDIHFDFDGFGIPLLPHLAKGGVLYGPTAFLGGEYPGARSNPEIVAPASMLRKLFREELVSVPTASAGFATGGMAGGARQAPTNVYNLNGYIDSRMVAELERKRKLSARGAA